MGEGLQKLEGRNGGLLPQKHNYENPGDLREALWRIPFADTNTRGEGIDGDDEMRLGALGSC